MAIKIDSGMPTSAISVPQQLLQRTLPTLERRVDDAIAGKPPFVDLDMSPVQIIDSVSLNWLLALQARLELLGSRLRILDPSPVMADVLLATRLDTRLTIETTFCQLPLPDSDAPAAAGVAPAAGGANGRQ